MFGSKKNEPTVRKSNNIGSGPSHALNSLVQGTEVSGTVTSDSDIRVDGKLSGDLNCASKMIIGPTGSIEGDVQCENALIEGSFKGNLKVRNTLHIKENAKVDGDISTDKLIVDQGAEFNVTCNMGTSPSQAKTEQRIAEKATS